MKPFLFIMPDQSPKIVRDIYRNRMFHKYKHRKNKIEPHERPNKKSPEDNKLKTPP